MIRCIAIDDEPLALFQLIKYIEKTPFLQLVKGLNSAFDAIEILSNETVDLIFVDINMPDLTGMDFVKSLKNKPLIIFTTAYSEYALEGFKVDALDYLLKPIGYSDFLKSANKALIQYELLNKEDKNQDKNDFIFIKADHKMVKIYIRDILFIEAQSEYIRIYRRNNKPVMTSMKAIQEILPCNLFMRVHRSYIINLQEISSVIKGRILLQNEVSIPIGEQHKADFNSYLNHHSL